jgi:hypothetical protein
MEEEPVERKKQSTFKISTTAKQDKLNTHYGHIKWKFIFITACCMWDGNHVFISLFLLYTAYTCVQSMWCVSSEKSTWIEAKHVAMLMHFSISITDKERYLEK